MPKLIFKLRNVPDDEVTEVHQLLKDNNIDYYETSAGNWSISMPGLWLKTDKQLNQAKQILEEYQKQRAKKAREDYLKLKAEGKQRTLFDEFKDHPIHLVTYFTIIATLIFLPIKLFMTMLN